MFTTDVITKCGVVLDYTIFRGVIFSPSYSHTLQCSTYLKSISMTVSTNPISLLRIIKVYGIIVVLDFIRLNRCI